MNWLVIFIVFCALITSAFCETDEIPIEELTDDRTTLIWKPTDAKSIIVRADDGYQIDVQTLQFNVDGESDDYVTVKSVGDDEEESDALMFTYTVSGKPSYLYNYNEVQADYVGTNQSNNFSIQFTRVGEATTTTSEVMTSPTPEPMPTSAPDDDPTLTVYLYGQAAENFNTSQIKSLQDAIAMMGVEYCKVQNCPLNGTITLNNVKIQDLQQCPILWQNYHKCVNLTFGLPIVKLNSFDNNALWDGYQLNRAHLKIMWDTYAHKHIPEGLEIYDVPNINIINTTRLVLICLTIVILVILILVTRHVMQRINKRRRKLSDTVSIMGQPSNRNSQLSLTPHYLQELPPLFSNDFPLYPEKMNQKNYSDFDNSFTDDIELSTSPSAPKMFNLSGNEPDDKIDADA